MQTLPVPSRLILAACSLLIMPGCFSLSLGSKTCTGDHPETKARIMSLEQRVSELEQIISPPTPGPTATLSQPAGAIDQPQGQQGFYGKT
ncbi:hypothetical protein Pan97_05320 [Bremerella volcania]|uniref:Uncharacterized protein n=1 Tax=Bremerella volcania TaxID=2527984 RepID=A0A518C2U4_9BACT|nr:hypothetical protein [Bremerella volcania]QDU73556.1 hypothetical protein Pan97_05320 [Bremerella volcania]